MQTSKKKFVTIISVTGYFRPKQTRSRTYRWRTYQRAIVKNAETRQKPSEPDVSEETFGRNHAAGRFRPDLLRKLLTSNSSPTRALFLRV